MYCSVHLPVGLFLSHGFFQAPTPNPGSVGYLSIMRFRRLSDQNNEYSRIWQCIATRTMNSVKFCNALLPYQWIQLNFATHCDQNNDYSQTLPNHSIVRCPFGDKHLNLMRLRWPVAASENLLVRGKCFVVFWIAVTIRRHLGKRVTFMEHQGISWIMQNSRRQ